MAESKRPHDASAGGWSGRFGEPVSDRVKRYTASVDFDRRLAKPISPAPRACTNARSRRCPGSDDLEATERGCRRSAARSRAANFLVARPRDVHFNIEAPDRAAGDAASACTPGARATIRSRPTSVLVARRNRRAHAGPSRCAGDLSSRGTACRYDHARLRICRSRNRLRSATICSRTRRCSRATPNASATAGIASTGCPGSAALRGRPSD